MAVGTETATGVSLSDITDIPTNAAKALSATATEILKSLEGQSLQQSQIIVSKAFDLPVVESPKITAQKDESVRFEVTLSKEQWQKLQHMRELLSTSLPLGTWDQVLEHMADNIIKAKTKPVTKTHSEEITPARRRKILQRDGCCQFKDKTSGRQCASKWNLQVDHRIPIWAGGTNEDSNLQALCANHNRHKYKQEAGLK